MDIKDKAVCQVFFLAQENDSCCFHGYQPMKENFEEKKDFDIKKDPSATITNYSGSSGGQSKQSAQSDQTLSWFKKKVKWHGKQDQVSNTLAI